MATEVATVNHHVIERVYPDDPRVSRKTLAHHIARYRFAAHIQEPKGDSLDICCGSGYGVEILRLAGYSAKGFDRSKEAITYARTHYPFCSFEQTDISTAYYGTNSLVTFYEAIEHLSFEEGIEAIRKTRLSIQKGILVVSTPRDLNEKYNLFHKSQWEVDHLKDALRVFFTTVDMLGQDWDTALISDVNPEGNDFHLAVCTVA